MNAIAPCTLPDDADPLAQQMRALKELADYAMRMARIAVEQYEASAAPPADSATPARRQSCPGSIFMRAARVVQNCLLSQSRLLAGLPMARETRPRTTAREAQRDSAREAANPIPAAEQSSAEPVRQALQTVTRNHPQGQKLLSASLENLAAALTANPRVIADPPDLFRRVCDATGIRLNPAQWRKAARDLACEIRPVPA